MGQLVLAAKVTHVPSLMLSEVEGSPLGAARAEAVKALRELGRRAKERSVSTFVVFDTHWLSNFGYHINANTHHRGSFTSHEAPQMIQDLQYDFPGNTALAEAIAGEAAASGLNVIAHKVASLGLEYGTIVPMPRRLAQNAAFFERGEQRRSDRNDIGPAVGIHRLARA
jgi:3,4-dihydroxyphenylacetate 2,3-dioxygenase